MQIYPAKEREKYKRELLFEIECGAVFVYPTDTIYGIGCNAFDMQAARQIRRIKKRETKPFSIIAPSKEWIIEHCVVEEKHKKWLQKLPGKYTLIFKLKNKHAITKEVTQGMIGVRMPKHWISEIAKELGIPLVTTSVNITGQPPIINIKEIPKTLQKKIDFAIDEGTLQGRPSTVVDMTTGKVIRK